MGSGKEGSQIGMERMGERGRKKIKKIVTDIHLTQAVE